MNFYKIGMVIISIAIVICVLVRSLPLVLMLIAALVFFYYAEKIDKKQKENKDEIIKFDK